MCNGIYLHDIPGSTDFLPYVGEKIFGSAKRRFHIEPGADDDSHRFDNINFSLPMLLQRLYGQACITFF